MLAVQRKTLRQRRLSCRSDEGDGEVYGDDYVDAAQATVIFDRGYQRTIRTIVQIVLATSGPGPPVAYATQRIDRCKHSQNCMTVSKLPRFTVSVRDK